MLFDIDGTLVDCGGTAGKCFAAVFRRVFGVRCPAFSVKEIAGLTDSAILSLMTERARLTHGSVERRSELFELYSRELAKKFTSKPPRSLPGAAQAVQRLQSLPGCVPGLLTGSTQATAKLKLERSGIGFKRFVCGAFAEDGERRELLPPIARARFARLFGCNPQLTIVVGDTPRDVEAAHATGCESIGVATGHYDTGALITAGARTVLPDLSDADSFCQGIADLVGRQGRQVCPP
ncbi:MAG: HAD family hydrolase [Candidatus Binatia bacterium]